MYLIIDIGNTSAKIAHVQADGMLLSSVSTGADNFKFQDFLQKEHIAYILSNVSAHKVALPELPGLVLDYRTRLPFINAYGSPGTLGTDRMANLSAAAMLYPSKPVLIFSAGSCLTIDFISADGKFTGGNISPGLAMRWKAMHEFTGKLPLADKTNVGDVIGGDTLSALASGGLTGMLYEITGYYNLFSEVHGDLICLICGGDSLYLAEQLKFRIFARPELTLMGLYYILKHNGF